MQTTPAHTRPAALGPAQADAIPADVLARMALDLDAQGQFASGELLLKADASGHYRLEGAINDQPVQLLLDTGATRVTIPQQVADRLGLIAHGSSQVNTAAGQIRVERLFVPGAAAEDAETA